MASERYRITGPTIERGEDALIAARIAGPLRVGTLMGVKVNFQHELLPPDFEALPYWFVCHEQPNSAGILFPEEAKHPKKFRERRGFQPTVFARQGDRLTVESVEIVINDDRNLFDNSHDREVRIASLRLEHPTGEVRHLPDALAFYGRGRIVEHGTLWAFDHVVDRILASLGADELPAWQEGSMWTRSPAEMAGLQAREAMQAYQRIKAALAGNEVAEADLWMFANTTALMGFLLSKEESAEAARRAELSVKNAKTTAADRTPPELIKALRGMAAANPTWKRGRIADELEGHSGYSARSLRRVLDRLKIGPVPSK